MKKKQRIRIMLDYVIETDAKPAGCGVIAAYSTNDIICDGLRTQKALKARGVTTYVLGGARMSVSLVTSPRGKRSKP